VRLLGFGLPSSCFFNSPLPFVCAIRGINVGISCHEKIFDLILNVHHATHGPTTI
jgi:hypothetical protein